MTALTRDFIASMQLFEACLFDSTLPDSEVERVRREMRRTIEKRRDNLSGSAILNFRKAIYGDHPYARPKAGELEDVDAISRDDLERFMHSQVQPQRLVVGIVGDVDIDETVALVQRWAERSVEEAPLHYDPATWEPSHDGPRSFSENRERQQAHIVLGYPGVSSNDEDADALYLLAAILGGQGGRLFRDLRDERSLAYSVTAWSSSSEQGGDTGGYIATSADKMDEAVSGLRRHFADVAENGVTQEELERARRLKIGARDVSSQKRAVRASRIVSDVLFDFGIGYSMRFAEQLETVTTEDIQRVAQRVVRKDSEVLSVIEP
jgi:zinc protease